MRMTVAPVSAIHLGRTAVPILGGRTLTRRHPGPGEAPPFARGNSRAYLKALREAELAAWNAAGSGRIEATADPLRMAQAEIQRQRQSDRRVFAAIALAAAFAVTLGLLDSLHFASHWAAFVRAVRIMIG